MKERPILFSTLMVRALLDGGKTQTRRPVKGFALEDLAPGMFTPEYVALPENHNCPYGYAGDRLWVRESFWGCDLPGYGDQPCVVYDDEWIGKDYQPVEPRPWGRKFGRIPSIHMPRESSRILLEIVSVRIERLNDCSEADAWAEGCKRGYPTDNGGFFPAEEPDPSGIGERGWDCARDWYTDLWEEINGAGSWEANPFVWAITFKRVTP